MDDVDGRGAAPGSRTRVVFAYGAAAAMVPYLLIKVSWVVGGLSGLVEVGEEFSLAGWVLLNAVTIVMAATGIVLGLALARPWGRRIPALPLLACAWIGSGFLVPMLPYLLVGSLAGGNGGATGGDGSTMPVWEAVLIDVGFAGLGLGLAVALPIYLRERWPAAFQGRVRKGPPGGRSGVAAATMTAVLGVLQLVWAAGGTLGLAQPEFADPDWRLLTGNAGVWALVAAACAFALTSGRVPGLPRWIPVTLGWVSSGFLFAWSCWKLPLVGYLAVAAEQANRWPENLGVAGAQAVVGVVAGAATLAVVVRAVRGRGEARRRVEPCGRVE
ncbi:hypothetical protein [Micromonospora costi]|uniref:hypothetical protein n=1 Tax=Micromonospora costi TaxID=1530042 RepID=UPI001319EEA0|nr:hypothetical protein [Micromonospora costi]